MVLNTYHKRLNNRDAVVIESRDFVGALGPKYLASALGVSQ